MIDESFHLTPLDVRRTEFPAALRGYDKARVEEFRDRVANELERLTRINQELESKAKGFHEQLRAFRERDKALNDALVSAQQLRAEVREQADREAQLIRREARAEGERIINDARVELRSIATEIEGLERARRAYLAQFRSMVARQLAELDAIPDLNSARPANAAASAGPSAAATGSAPAAANNAVSPAPVAPPPPPPPGTPPANGADGLRVPAPTPAWLNSVPGE
jgi:cell division initiation protein